MTEKIQWGNPFDDAGIEEMADWMAPRLGQSPMYQMAIDGADPDLLAVLLERLMNEYLEYRESRPVSAGTATWCTFPWARMTRTRNRQPTSACRWYAP